MIGETISHYKIIEKLGEGGMGIVYKAQDISLNRAVALKFLPPHLTKNEATRKRFITEAQAASALDHPNICNIHEINETEDGQLFICMAFYEGESLEQKIKNGSIPIDEAINIFLQIALGLQAAHDKNIIHRDIKPGNIIITNKGETKIVDFGLARLAGEKLSESFSTKGTIAYMAPEVIRGQPGDHRSDIWSLGVVFFEMLTGHLPYDGDYPEPLMFSIVNEKPHPLSKYISGYPELIQTIIDKLLKKDRAERYQSISDLLNDLKPLVKDKKIIVIKQRSVIFRLLSENKVFLYGSGVLILSIIFLIIFGRSYFFPDQNTGTSLAVLSLKSISQDSSQTQFADGMTEYLRTKLAEISGLRVTESISSMAYYDSEKKPSEIASELNIEYLLYVMTILIGDSASILIRLNNDSEDVNLWGKEYKNEIKKILGMPGAIAKDIAGQINIKLTPQLEKRLTETREVDPEIMELFFKGLLHINGKSPNEINRGLAYLEQAVAKDPDEPLAQAHLALGLSIMTHSPKPIPGASQRIKEAALKAIEVDNNIAEAHLALAMVKIYGDRDIKGTGEFYRRALEINPNLTLALYHYAWHQFLIGNFEKAPELFKEAIKIDPYSSIFPDQLAFLYYIMQEYDESLKYALAALELEPNDSHILYVLGAIYAATGKYDKAIEVQKRSVELSPFFEWGLAHTYALADSTEKAQEIAEKLEKRNEVWDTWCLAVIYGALGNADKMFYWLEQAEKRGHAWILWIWRTDIWFGAYKDDPRFLALAQRLNIPE